MFQTRVYKNFMANGKSLWLHQGTSLFTSAVTNQRGFSKGGVKRSSGPIFRIPGGDRVAVRVGAVQVEKVNDQMGQGRRV